MHLEHNLVTEIVVFSFFFFVVIKEAMKNWILLTGPGLFNFDDIH